MLEIGTAKGNRFNRSTYVRKDDKSPVEGVDQRCRGGHDRNLAKPGVAYVHMGLVVCRYTFEWYT